MYVLSKALWKSVSYRQERMKREKTPKKAIAMTEKKNYSNVLQFFWLIFNKHKCFHHELGPPVKKQSDSKHHCSI